MLMKYIDLSRRRALPKPGSIVPRCRQALGPGPPVPAERRASGNWAHLIFPAAGLHGITLEQQVEDQTEVSHLSAPFMGVETSCRQLCYFPIQHPSIKNESLDHRTVQPPQGQAHTSSGGCFLFLTHVKDV